MDYETITFEQVLRNTLAQLATLTTADEIAEHWRADARPPA